MDKINFKKVSVFVIVLAVICLGFAGVAAWNFRQEKALAKTNEMVITLQIGNPEMTINGETTEIDSGRGTAPIIVNDRTLVPIRAIIEAVGGNVQWREAEKEAVLTYNGDTIRLVMDSTTAYVNDNANVLDTAPTVINDRTMLPIRFIAENFKFNVEWDGNNNMVTITTAEEMSEDTQNQNAPDESSESKETGVTVGLEHRTDSEDAPEVFFTSEITPESLVKIYQQLNFISGDNVAVKMSTGEPPASNYLRPELIKDLIQSVDGTIVECNTAYGGSRANTAMHRQVAEDHGFTAITDVDIMDENGSMSIPVTGGTRLSENFVGANLANYDSMITLSHFKGHAMAGFGGAIKNMSIGIGSSEGKAWIHSGGTSKTSMWGGDQDAFLESMAEATSSVIDYMDGKIVYINVMNRLSVDCDCDGNPAEPDMHDVGILASYDPVALDQACIDIVYNTNIDESGSLRERIESRNGIHTLEHADEIGLGSREYRLVNLDS